MQRVVCFLAVCTMLIAGCGVDWFPETQKSSTSPNGFSFSPATVTGVALGSTQTSNAITVSGIPSGSAPISVSGDPTSKYSINGAAFANLSSGTVSNGQTVSVQHTASSQVGTTVKTTLTIGDQSATFTSTTKNVADITAPPQTGVPEGTSVTSSAITLICVPGTYVVSITPGSTYSLDGITFTNVTQSLFINNGQTVFIQQFTATTPGGQVTSQLTIDSGIISFTTTAL